MAYRSVVHERPGQTPPRVVFGNDLRLPLHLKFGTNANGGRSDKEVDSIQEGEMRDIHAMVKKRTKIMSDKMKARYDKAIKSQGFIDDDWVLLYNPQRKERLSPKL